MTAVLDTRDITKMYKMGGQDVHALRGVTITIQPGDFVAIMGPSGCGKSTWLQIAGMLDQPTSGRVFLEGTDVSQMGDSDRARVRREKIGFIFQSFNLLPQESAKSNVELPLEYAGISGKERERRAIRALEAVGLGDRLNNKPNQLSGGQRQRVAIARALVNEPAIIFADEPTGALDSKSGVEVMEILRKLNADGNTIVMVTHDPGLAQQTRRIIRLLDGKLVEDRAVVPNAAQPSFGPSAGSYGPPAGAAQAPAPYEIAVQPPYRSAPPPLAPNALPGQQVCAKCGTENRPVAKFCRHCGFKLSLTPSQTQELRMRLAGADLICTKCSALNRPIAKFCYRCGTRTINSFEPQAAQIR